MDDGLGSLSVEATGEPRPSGPSAWRRKCRLWPRPPGWQPARLV